jgi:prepilin-type N-terminal cleavage/methylation domain-containing protein
MKAHIASRPPVPSPRRGGLGRGEEAGTCSAITCGSPRAHHPSPNPSPFRGGGRRSEGGFTLLEVILALVILGAALAMLGEVMRLANRNAEESRLEARAQILAASIMDQVIAGVIDADSASRQQLEVDDITPWVYSITVGTSAIDGILPVEVIVEQDIETNQGPIKYRLFRWLPETLERRASPSGQGPGGAGGSGGGSAPPGGAGGPPL